MPLAEERLNEKPPFDVYAVMMVLTFLLTLGAILMLNDELRKNWFGAEPPGTEHAEHLTVLNSQTDEQKTTHGESPWTQITEEDMRDYPLLAEGEELKITKYPDWMDINQTGVKFLEEIQEENAFDMEKVPAEERATMKSTYVEQQDPTKGVLEDAPGGATEPPATPPANP